MTTSTPFEVGSKLTQFETVSDYLKTKLTAPDLVHPAIYVKPGLIDLKSVPYETVGDEKTVMLDHNASHATVKVQTNTGVHDYFIVNQDYATPNRARSYKDSHMRFGYGLTALPGLPKLPYMERFAIPESTDIGTWWQECIASAIHIKQRYGNIFLCFSGGLDSELMALAFIEAKVDFIPFSLVYKYNEHVLNMHDLEHSFKFCQDHGLNLMTKDVDVLRDLAGKRYKEYFIDGVYETYFLLPYLYTHNLLIEYINSLGGVPVMGSDQVELKKNKVGQICIGDGTYEMGLTPPTWAHIKQKECIYNFFTYSPEQIFSYISMPDVINTKTVKYSFKRDISTIYGSNKLAYHEKRTGFEMLKFWLYKVYQKDMFKMSMDIIDAIDWSKKPMTQFIHPISDIVADRGFNKWEVMRTTPKDFFGSGFNEDDTSYYDI